MICQVVAFFPVAAAFLASPSPSRAAVGWVRASTAMQYQTEDEAKARWLSRLDQPSWGAASDDRPLAGKVAVITGSSSGIGLAIAETLAGAGCDLVVHGSRAPDQMSGLESDLASQNEVRCKYVQADVSDMEQVTALIDTAVATFGKVDILVNNAGIQHVSPLADFPEEAYDRVMNINLKATFMLTKFCLPGMQRRGYGRIINIASVHGKVASVNKAAYVASKHAVVGLTKVTALEMAGTGVTAVTVCPGWVLTPLVQKQIDTRAAASGRTIAEETKVLVSEKMPSGEAVRTEDFGKMVEFLCSEAAAQITGTEIVLDGGWTAQ